MGVSDSFPKPLPSQVALVKHCPLRLRPLSVREDDKPSVDVARALIDLASKLEATSGTASDAAAV